MDTCINGHPRTPDNIYQRPRPDGYRCRACRKIAKDRYRSTPEYREWRRKNYAKNRERINELQRERMRGLREDAIDAYGGKCACCGEGWLDYLHIDHINSGGREHRRQVYNVYRDLQKRGYPDGYQVLCANCNMAKERGGCPSH